jgi:hypothetical protein
MIRVMSLVINKPPYERCGVYFILILSHLDVS